MGLDGCGGIVEGVRVLRRFSLKLTLVGQRAGAAVAEEAIVTDELHVVTRMTRFDAVDADGVAIGRVARTAAVEVVHGERRVRRDLVQALAAVHRFLHGVLVVENLVSFTKANNNIVSHQFSKIQSSFRAVLEHFECSFRAVYDRFLIQGSFRAF